MTTNLIGTTCKMGFLLLLWHFSGVWIHTKKNWEGAPPFSEHWKCLILGKKNVSFITWKTMQIMSFIQWQTIATDILQGIYHKKNVEKNFRNRTKYEKIWRNCPNSTVIGQILPVSAGPLDDLCDHDLLFMLVMYLTPGVTTGNDVKLVNILTWKDNAISILSSDTIMISYTTIILSSEILLWYHILLYICWAGIQDTNNFS